MLVEHIEHELLSHPTSLQELPAPLDTQTGRATQEEGKKSTGETCLDKIIAGVQLIFCFHLINFSALPPTLQICLLNQLEATLTAGRMLPRSLLLLGPAAALQHDPPKGGEGEAAEGKVGFPRESAGLTLPAITV